MMNTSRVKQQIRFGETPSKLRVSITTVLGLKKKSLLCNADIFIQYTLVFIYDGPLYTLLI